MQTTQALQTPTTRRAAAEATSSRRSSPKDRAVGAPSASPSGLHVAQTPLQVPRYFDDDGVEYWKVQKPPARARWTADGYGKGNKAVPCSIELALQFFETDARLWAQFKAGYAGKKGLTIADDIAHYMKQQRAQYARPADKIKLHIEEFYRDVFTRALEIATDTGVGEGSVVTFRGKKMVITDLDDLEKMCPRFERWKAVIGDKVAVHRDLVGSIDSLGGNTDALADLGVNMGRARARDDVLEAMDDEEDDSADDVSESPSTPPVTARRSLAVPGATLRNESSSSLASSSSRLSSKSALSDIKALGLSTEKRFAEANAWRQKKMDLLERQVQLADERAKREIERSDREFELKRKQMWSTHYAAVVGALGHEKASEQARMISGLDERTLQPL